MSKRDTKIAWTLGGLLLLILIALSQHGCSGPAPATVVLPSTVPVRKALAVVEDSHKQVQQLAEHAAASGLVAGSAAAQALVKASLDEGLLITALHSQVFTLTTQIAAAQPRIDTLAKHDAAETKRANDATKAKVAAEESCGRWRLAFFVLLVVGGALVSLLGMQLQKALLEAEEAAAHLVLAAGRTALHAVEKIPAVVGTVAKVGAVAAVL